MPGGGHGSKPSALGRCLHADARLGARSAAHVAVGRLTCRDHSNMLKGDDTALARWIHISDPDSAVKLLPAWFAPRMMVKRGSYGFLIATGDIVRVSRITAVHVSSGGTILIDVLLDRAGIPRDVDAAWQSKHFLGAPVAGAALATLNLDQIAMAVEFEAAEIAETQREIASLLTAAPLELPHRQEETADR